VLSSILEAHGRRTGWLTTVNTRICDEVRPNAVDHTTPEAPIVQRTLAEMRAAGVDVAILETSSHALDLDRVHAVRYRVGVFTNLSPEHLNFHGSFEAYRAAKLRLFRAPAIRWSGRGERRRRPAHCRAASPAHRSSHLRPRRRRGPARSKPLPFATRRFVRPDGTTIATRLIGRFNVVNWLAAFGAATYFGATLDDLRQAAAGQEPVPGRMNLVDRGQPFAVVVDFAHTPQALEKALDTVRALGARRVLLLFGLAGGRDAANRPVMGALASRKSDYFVISTDDPD
jgi:UDP-N-acetylmuramyl-tripeptide synthetase